MKRTHRAGLIALGLVTASGCTALKKMKLGMAENPYAGDPDSAVRGKAAFDVHCVRCHGTGGVGDGPDAEGLTARPQDLTGLAGDRLIAGVAMNVAYGKNEMPPYQNILTEQELWDVSAFVISLGTTD